MKINFSNYTEETKEVKNLEFIIDSNISRLGTDELSFEVCSFTFLSTGKIHFQNCIIRNCIFNGLDNLHTFTTEAGRIEIISCKEFQGNQINGQFRSIHIQNSVLNDFKDYSLVTNYYIGETEVTDFKIKGECENFHTNIVRFQSSKNIDSTWNKTITKRAICGQTIFDNVKINPFYLATKCHEKSTLDISRSRLIDDWSRLRKKYSGLSLFIVFFLTFLFFLPLFTHSFFLLILSKIEGSFYVIKKIPLWEALLFGGKKGFNAVIYSILTTILLFYNIGRIYMTISIARLREEEIFLKDSNFNLVSIHPEKYNTQLKLDKILSIMFWISVGYTLLKIIDTLIILVPSFN